MQFQSDIAGCNVSVPNQEELSGIGAAYMSGIAIGLWDDSILTKMKRLVHEPSMDETKVKEKYDGWKAAVGKVQ